MSTKKVLAVFAGIGLIVSVPFVIVHLVAAPDDAPITPLQHVVAALANFFGPWGAAIVRLVDFPNAGLRSFSWTLAAGLTIVSQARERAFCGRIRRCSKFVIQCAPFFAQATAGQSLASTYAL